MDIKAPTASLSTFKELRLDLQLASSGSIVQIKLPSNSTFSRGRSARRVIGAYPDCKSEDEYRRKHVASSSNICFRREGRYPRNILWRCLENDTVLELRSIDLSKSENESKDATVVVQIGFPAPIRPSCVGLADSEHADTLDVFVLTKSNDLYTFTVRPSFFCSTTASEEELERWSQNMRPSSLSVSQAYRLTSCSSRELVFALTDGRLLRLTRQAGADGYSWVESAYSDGQWGSSLRGLIRWQNNQVRYEGTNLDPNTALAAASSPDGSHLFSVTLSHTLKVWSTQTGKVTLTRDLLGADREPGEASRLTLDPGLRHVLAIDSSIRPAFPGDQYYLFTYTPHEGGSFKVWGVRDADFGGDGIRDLFDEDMLRVPDPDDGALWTLTDFQIAGSHGSDEISMWIMLRLNRRYKLYNKRFSNLASLASEWPEDWEQAVVADHTLQQPDNDFELPRLEPLSLSLDTRFDMCWLALTNAVASIRACTDTEMLIFNSSKVLLGGPQTLVQSIEADHVPARSDSATLIEAAARFRAGLTGLTLDDAVRAELWQDPSFPAHQRIQAFYDRAGFDQVGDRHYNELLGSLNNIGGLDGLGTDSFLTILETLPSEVSKRSQLLSTSFGRKALVNGAKEMVSLHQRIVADLLYLLVFIDQEIDREEYAMASLEPARVFEEFVDDLRLLQVMNWVCTMEVTVKKHKVSVLEAVFSHDIRPQSALHQPASTALSNTIRDLIKWMGGGNDPLLTLDQVTTNIQCNLLVKEELALATKFLRFLPSTAWATYVRGRHCLLTQDFAAAAIHFQKAAFNLSRPVPKHSFYFSASVGLVTQLDASRFAAGLSNYYAHIVDLFSSPSVSAHSQTSQFASLSLQHQQSGRSELRSDMLSRLFYATLSLGDFDSAFGAIARYTDRALRHAALKQLVHHAIRVSAVDELLRLPFDESMKHDVDELLVEKAKSSEADHDSASGPSAATKILYAWRVKRGDYRGAAACLVQKLQAQRAAGFSGKKRRRVRMAGGSGKGDGVLNDYLASINALTLLGQADGVEEGENEGWVFVEQSDGSGARSLLRLRDLRREYQEEMDMRERWEKGRFALTAAADDDEDDDGDAQMAM